MLSFLNLVWIICVPIVLLYFFFGRFLLLLFMTDPQGPAIDTGMLFLRILSPFYFVDVYKRQALWWSVCWLAWRNTSPPNSP